MSLDELVELAVELRGPQQPARIRLARDLYDSLKREAVERLAFPAASPAASVYGIPLEVDDELPPGEWRADDHVPRVWPGDTGPVDERWSTP